MEYLLNKNVMFIPSCSYTNNKGYTNDTARPVKGKIIEIRNGWFRVRWYAGDSVQHECFKEADIGRTVTLLGKRS